MLRLSIKKRKKAQEELHGLQRKMVWLLLSIIFISGALITEIKGSIEAIPTVCNTAMPTEENNKIMTSDFCGE